MTNRLAALAQGGASVAAIAWTGILAAPVPAIAQSEPANASSEKPAETDSGAPGEIVVTAQRRSESLQDVPISIAVVGGETLSNRSVGNFEQLAPLVPNLTVAKSPAANVIVLRGIGSSPGSPSLDQSVVMFIDGVYAGNARQFAAPFLDIERLEILRGPQGALVGRNTSAGAINIISRKPGAYFGGYLNATYDFKLDGPTIEGGMDVPVANGFAIRAVGRYSDVEGYIHNTQTDRDEPARRDIVGRITGVLDNGGPVTLTAKFEHADVRQHGTPLQAIAPDKGEYFDYTKDTVLTSGPEFDNIRSDNAVLQAGIDLGGPQLVWISAYSGFKQQQRIDGDFYFRNLATADFDQKFDQLSQELRLVSPGGQTLDYVFGLYYSKAKLVEERTTGVLFAPAASTYRIFRQDSSAFSAYAALTYHLSDALRVNGSLRYTDESKDANFALYAGPNAATQRTGTLRSQFDGSLSKGTLDPAASVQFDLSSNAMLYASFGKGSKSGGFQGAISNATEDTFAFRPERSTSFEGGIKLTLPGLGYFNLSAFHTVYKDLQVSTALPSPDGTSAPFFTGNAPKARTAGAEAEFFLQPANFLELQGSLAWLPTAKYVKFTSGPCFIGRAADGSAIGSCDLSGSRLGFAPRYSGSLTATVKQPLSNALEVRASLSPTFQGRSFRDFANDPVTAQDAFVKLDARFSLARSDGKWELALIGKNITDKRTISFGSSGGLANTFLSPTARIGVIDPPRTIAVQAKVKF
ncbi:TonB-dependent receptor [Novosphingobium mathurense]|uniref:Outer membrane receptor proteins, mostly Fe transport n=1 Tax=Novosphingobium mathurense TaxID=428990 RepID=A0A1U6HV00_9SPHN|nr:TonB-dependent receptor [Novosphingobium mathurense]SLJ99632.1 Outer membrane receptor proteins, mostly Fe transport [Novosphingobium mathurense]